MINPQKDYSFQYSLSLMHQQMKEEATYNHVNEPYLRENSLAKSQILHSQDMSTKVIRVTSPKKQHYLAPKAPKPSQAQKDNSVFNFFKCCADVEAEPEQDFKMLKNRKQVSKVSLRNEPYVSTIRLKNRQCQPIVMFNDQLISQKLTKSRWFYE